MLRRRSGIHLGFTFAEPAFWSPCEQIYTATASSCGSCRRGAPDRTYSSRGSERHRERKGKMSERKNRGTDGEMKTEKDREMTHTLTHTNTDIDTERD